MNNTCAQTPSAKRRFAAKLRGLAMLLGGLVLTAGNTFAEGTKEISNNDANTNSALLVYQSRGTGPYLTNIPENRIRIRIADFTTERIYYGFKWRDYNSSQGAPSGVEVGAYVWMRIYDPNGNEVTAARQRFNSTTAGYIANFTQGVNGPNILGVTNGYAPLSFTPTMNGEYSVVFYKVSGNGSDATAIAGSSSQQFRSSFWDITVANSTQKFTGRVFSQNWGLVALTASETVNALSKAAPSFFSYSHDSTLIKLGFVSNTSGFAPIAYDIAFTDYGVDTNTALSWAQSRKSSQPGSTNVPLTNGFKVFLNEPSSTLYPIAQISGSPAFGAVPITGCPGGNLTAHYTMPDAGDVRIVFDIDGNGDGYTPNTRDFVLEAFNRPAGAGTITWDGKDGQGNNLVQGTAVRISATYRRGRFNLPIYDAEVNVDGMYIQTIAPLSSPSNRLYWDDASLPATQTTTACSDPAANVTGAGMNNSFVGTVSSLASPTRAWNGTGNLGNVVPAPSVLRGGVANDANGEQCDDYGNVRVLNTWGWALEADGQLVNVTFGCFSVSGNVFNDVNGKNNNLIDQSATNPVALPALYAYMVSSDSVIRAVTTVGANGTYSFTNVPGANYNIVISTAQLAVNTKLNYATQVTLPAGWSNVGEQAGNTANVGLDPIADGILPIVLNGDKTNMNFGIQRLPVPGAGANTAANPGGTTQVTVPANTFTNTTVSSDYDGGSVTGIRIVSFPSNATTIVINGNSYNSTTWPAGGVLVPTNASGAPTQSITVDPDFDGPGSVVITFKSVDNAGKESTANGTATMTFGANISGRVWNDANGDAVSNGTEKAVSGDRNSTNAGASVTTTTDLFASIVGADDRVIKTMRLNTDGTYAFTNMPVGATYKVVLTSGNTAPAVNSLLTAGTNAAGWVATGVNVNGTATTTNTTNIVNLGVVNENKVNTNFGIERTPTADAKSYSVSNNSFTYTAPSGSLSGYPALNGYAHIQMSNAAIGPLTGTDPEDCATASSCSTGSSFSIQSINSRTKLYYNFGGSTGVREVVPGTATARIDNFDPAKMVIYAQNGGGTVANPFAFTYTIIDKANVSSPAVNYTITTATALPVSLVNFKAVANDRNVTLSWSTLLERNNKGFAIERSFDAKNWQEVIFEASKGANGTSAEKLDYVTTDRAVNPGNVYYRLKQLDYDGVATLSEVRMVNIKSSGMSIYPNPARNSVTILGIATQYAVTVYDVTGRVVMAAEVDAGSNTLNIASLTDGVYTVVIKNENNVAGTFKLVKN